MPFASVKKGVLSLVTRLYSRGVIACTWLTKSPLKEIPKTPKKSVKKRKIFLKNIFINHRKAKFTTAKRKKTTKTGRKNNEIVAFIKGVK